MPNIKAPALTVWDKMIFLSVAMATKVHPGIQILKYSESESPDEHFCEVSLKFVSRFQKRRLFK